MLSDLAASGGCLLEPGDSGVNNPLAQFSRSVVDGGRQQAEALASAPSGPPALHAHGVGPALPPLGAEEAAFLDEYHATRPAEAAAALAGAWAHAAAAPPPQEASAEAWRAAQAAQAAAPPQPAAHAHAGAAVHATMRAMVVDPARAVDVAAALAPAQLPHDEAVRAVRRAGVLTAHLRPAPPEAAAAAALEPAWRRGNVDAFPPAALEEAFARASLSPAAGAAREAAWAAATGVAPTAAGGAAAASEAEVVRQMVAAMRGSSDPRWRSSQLLGFLGELESGAKRIDGGQLLEGPAAAAAAAADAAAAGSAAAPSAADGAAAPADFARMQGVFDAYNTAQRQAPAAAVLEAAARDAGMAEGAAAAELAELRAREASLEAAWAAEGARAAGGGADADGRLASTGWAALDPAALSMEEAWREAVEVGGVDVGLDELQRLWEGVQGGDYELDLAGAWDAAQADLHEEYSFSADNPYVGQSGLLEKGVAAFEAGELADAILALQALVQAEPEHSTGWQTLGRAHADSDDDTRAIACLRRAVASDAHNLDALLALGVSYTNELDQTRALHHLQHWLESHPEFAGLELPKAGGAAAAAAAGGPEAAAAAARYGNPYALQQQLTRTFVAAAEARPDNADLHAVLGVLHNLSRDYPQAVAAFERALQLRPTDYSLWNKLGATQANATACDAAVPCYIRALELKPQYVRALSNLGISYGNMNNQDAAASCYLKALSLNPEARHIWTYLNMTFTAMNRPDLVAKAMERDHAQFAGVVDF